MVDITISIRLLGHDHLHHNLGVTAVYIWLHSPFEHWDQECCEDRAKFG